MAFMTTMASSGEFGYNIDFSVGAAAANHPTDVMLVQALLRMMYYEQAHDATFPIPPGSRGLKVDGRLGPETMKHIRAFQSSLKAASGDIRAGDKQIILLDGVFDPYRNDGFSTKCKMYTLFMLNVFCRSDDNPQFFRNFVDLPTREDIPVQLRGELNQPERDSARKYKR